METVIALEMEGWRPSGSKITVRFDHLPVDCVVAVVGDNGVGKSTMLKILGWCEHGDELVGKGGHKDLISDESDEAQAVGWFSGGDGSVIKVRRRQGKRSHQVFIDHYPDGGDLSVGADGWLTCSGPVNSLCTGLVTTSGEILKSLGSMPTGLYKAAYAAGQSGEGSFFSTTKVQDRIDLLSDVCEVLWTQELADAGVTGRKALKGVVSSLKAKADSVREIRQKAVRIQGEVAEAREQAEIFIPAVEAARIAVAASAKALAEATGRRSALQTSHDEADRGHRKAQQLLREVAAKLASLEKSEDRESVQQMKERLTTAQELSAERAAKSTEYYTAEKAAASARTSIARLEQQMRSLPSQSEFDALEEDLQRLQDGAGQAPEIQERLASAEAVAKEAKAKLAGLSAAVPALRTAEARVEAATVALENATRVGAFVDKVPCGGRTLTLVKDWRYEDGEDVDYGS